MPGNRRVSKVALGRRPARQRPQRRVTHYLLPLQIRSSDMADDSLRQRRSFRPDGEREKGTESFDRKRIGSACRSAGHGDTPVREDTVMAKRVFYGERREGTTAEEDYT